MINIHFIINISINLFLLNQKDKKLYLSFFLEEMIEAIRNKVCRTKIEKKRYK